jgi:hypothetical protein
MRVDFPSGLNNYLPYSSAGIGASNANRGAAAGQSTGAASSDQVSLSPAALALQTSGANAGTSAGSQSTSPDIAQEEQLLTTLADKSMAALGIITPAEESGTQVTFDSVSYNVSSSESVSEQSQQAGASGSGGAQTSTQFSATQAATFTGEGEIVTANGQDFKFQIQLQLGQSEQGTVGTAATGAATGTASSSPASTSSSDPLSQLLDGLQSSPTSNNANSAGGNVSNAAPTSSTGINWDAILQQSESLFNLLDSLAGTSQAQASQASAASQPPANQILTSLST